MASIKLAFGSVAARHASANHCKPLQTSGDFTSSRSGQVRPLFCQRRNTMTQVRSHSPRKRSGVYSEEEKAWRGFYQRVGNPDIAVEILHQLDADADMKRSHLALYLCCKESLRTQKTRQARNKRIGQFVRWLADKMCVAPLQTVWRWLHQGRDVAVECLPEIRKEPAVRQVDRLARDAEFAQAKSDFDGQSSAPAKAGIEKAG
jgi:hypothetical protein